MDFEALVERIKAKKLQQVDARVWTQDWAPRWVAFADLIGFKYRCETNSKAVVVNLIFGFHRMVQASYANLPTLRLHQFTDAALAISDSCAEIVKFASQLQHQCLAHNAARIEQKRNHQFKYMLLPRITIAHGNVFQLPERPPPERDLAGIVPRHILAGEGVVRAYRIEKASAGTLISLGDCTSGEVRQLNASINRRAKGAPRVLRAFQQWQQEPDTLHHDQVTDLPWLLLRPEQSAKNDSLLLDKLPSVKAKLRAMIDIWERGFKEYVRNRTAIESIKHYGACQRHLTELLQLLQHRQRIPSNNLSDLLQEVQKLDP